jgi:exopolyphosphatase/guanosine-5'-triphosphate,3'-diphosphate pyrophosphatase
MIFDIGGGSTELVLIDTDGSAPSIRDWVSVPWGVVSLTEGVPVDIGSRETRQAGYDAMRAKAAESFEEFSQRLPRNDGDKYRMLGTSGTVTTLASLHLKLPCYNRNAIDGLIVPSVSMRQISQDLGSMAPSERAKVPCIGSDRAELVIAGCAILEAILDIWPAERLGIADRGIREGILRSLMAHGVTPSGTATPQTGKKAAPDKVSGKTASGKKAPGKRRSRNRSRKRTQSSDAARQDNSRQDRQ